MQYEIPLNVVPTSKAITKRLDAPLYSGFDSVGATVDMVRDSE